MSVKLKTFGVFCMMFLLNLKVNAEQKKIIKSPIDKYSSDINYSVTLSKSDKELLNTWSEDMLVNQINITAKYRLQMVRHKEHNFRKANNDIKWLNCIDISAKDIARSEHMYVENETGCLKTVHGEVQEKRHAVDQVEREIKSWRKSYKYITHFCSINYPGNEQACLVENIERDDYIGVLQRLIAMKIDMVEQFRVRLEESCANLEECLRVNLSSYLTTVRSIMEALNRCYRNKRE